MQKKYFKFLHFFSDASSIELIDDIIVVISELKVEYFCAMPLITIKQLSHELLSLQIKKNHPM